MSLLNSPACRTSPRLVASQPWPTFLSRAMMPNSAIAPISSPVPPCAGGTNPDKPLAVDNEAEPGLKWTALGKTSNSFYRAAGKDYKFEGTSGESHRVAFNGGGK